MVGAPPPAGFGGERVSRCETEPIRPCLGWCRHSARLLHHPERVEAYQGFLPLPVGEAVDDDSGHDGALPARRNAEQYFGLRSSGSEPRSNFVGLGKVMIAMTSRRAIGIVGWRWRAPSGRRVLPMRRRPSSAACRRISRGSNRRTSSRAESSVAPSAEQGMTGVNSYRGTGKARGYQSLGPFTLAYLRFLPSKRVAEATGFEPAISALTGLHVRPLHHASMVEH